MNSDELINIQLLESSLINSLLQKTDLEAKTGVDGRRIRTINLYVNNKNPKHITFIVTMGMFSAEFNVANGLKEKGSCYGLERYISDWAERESVKLALLKYAKIKKD